MHVFDVTLTSTRTVRGRAGAVRARLAAHAVMIRASPGARPYREMLGEVVLKHFEGHGTFMGTIIEYDEQTGFRIQVTHTHSPLGWPS